MDGMVELRCKYCGAPLDRSDVESDSPYVTCPSCGTTQQRVDARAYMDQMMGQIQSWISKAIPGGFSLAQQENVDPIARHNIFINNVKPMLDVEIRDYRFSFDSAMSSPLMVMPFSKGETLKSKHTSTQAFEFNAKLKSIEPLAVDGNDKRIVQEAEDIAMAYALIVNNSKLTIDTTPGRFSLMSKNFKEAAGAVRKHEGYTALATRLDALAEVCNASEMVLNGDTLGCSVGVERAISMFEKSKEGVLSDPRTAMMLRAIDVELSQTKTLKGVTDMVLNGTTRDPLKTLEIVDKVSAIDYPRIGNWSNLLGRADRDAEIYGYIERISSAKGDGTLPICTGGGDTLYPFWDVDLRYSFTTGSLFSKKTVEVTEDILVPATFTISQNALSDPRKGLTDIFSAAPQSSILDRIKGNEDSISGGSGIGRLTESAAENRPGNRTVVIPLSTRTEAVRLVEEYLKQCSATHSKLKLSSPKVKELVYIPCAMADGGISLPDEFRGLEPAILRMPEMRRVVTI